MDVLQAVVGGSDGCLFSYGHAGLGKLIPRVFCHFKSERETKQRKLSQRLLGPLLWLRKKRASLVAIPETTAGHISAPVPYPLYEQNF